MQQLDIRNFNVIKSNFRIKSIIYSIFLVLILQVMLLPISVFGKANPRMYIHNKLVQSDTSPYIENDRTMVPLRVIAENLGYIVKWDGEKYEVTIRNSNRNLKLYIGKTEVIKDSKKETIDVAPVIKNDRTFVPLRYIAETFNQVVIWDNSTETVYITRERDIPSIESDYKGRFVLINNTNLSEMDKNKKAPDSLKIGDIGLIIKTEGDLLYLNLIKPQGDVVDDWSFAEGYVPKNNCILNPRPNELEILSNVCRLKNGKIRVKDSLNGEYYLLEGNRFVNIKSIQKEKILIELPGGANDAWASINDVDFNFEYFIGNPNN